MPKLFTLSVIEPFASALMFGPKNWENRRSRLPAYVRNTHVLIHASKSQDYVRDSILMARVRELWPTMPEEHVLRSRMGYALGVRLVVDSKPKREVHDPWAFGPQCWNFSDDRFVLRERPLLRGQLFFFPSEVPPELSAMVGLRLPDQACFPTDNTSS